MSERVSSFNPIIIAIWLTSLVLFIVDYTPDSRISWSIPIIGSILLVQLYFVWKTNYDDMIEKDREKQVAALGGPTDVPTIDPLRQNLDQMYTETKNTTPIKKDPGDLININPQNNDQSTSE